MQYKIILHNTETRHKNDTKKYDRFVIAKLLKYIKISMQTSSDSFFTNDSLEIEKNLELVSRSLFCKII